MIFKYIGFLFTLLWSYFFIKSQSIFKKGSGFLITLFVTNVSWITFITACFYGFKNFSLFYATLGIVLSITIVQIAFGKLAYLISNKFENKVTLFRVKTIIEYLIIAIIIYFIIF
tara:strand:- start:240 stop:584 length:345 start_codon:yes stop_codon:yes gene_type:complete